MVCPRPSNVPVNLNSRLALAIITRIKVIARLDVAEVVAELFRLAVKHPRSELTMLIAENAAVFGELFDLVLTVIEQALAAEIFLAGTRVTAVLCPDHKTGLRAGQLFVVLLKLANELHVRHPKRRVRRGGEKHAA